MVTSLTAVLFGLNVAVADPFNVKVMFGGEVNVVPLLLKLPDDVNSVVPFSQDAAGAELDANEKVAAVTA